jgi:hypothetical protein
LIEESTDWALLSLALEVEVSLVDEDELLPPHAATVSPSAATSSRDVAERRSMSLLGSRCESRRMAFVGSLSARS